VAIVELLLGDAGIVHLRMSVLSRSPANLLVRLRATGGRECILLTI
jgi:hypothetical protein